MIVTEKWKCFVCVCVCVIRGCVTDPATRDIKLGPGTVLLLWLAEASKSPEQVRPVLHPYCLKTSYLPFAPQQVIVLNVDRVYRGSPLNYVWQHVRVCRTHFYSVTLGNMNGWLKVVAPSVDFMSILFQDANDDYFHDQLVWFLSKLEHYSSLGRGE